MPRRARLRAGSALVAAVALALAVPSVALADGPSSTPSPTPTASGSPSPSPARSAEAKRLGAEIAALQRTAEAKGKVAEQAGERAHDLRADAAAARLALQDANTAADAAAQQARASKARASAVAARLARIDAGTLPLSLMLNARSAGGVLDGLSTTSQLSVQSQLLYRQARDDQREAERLQAVAERRAGDATAASARAAKAFAAAKRQAADAKRDVQAALARQRALLKDLATEGVDGCDAVGDAPVDACLPTKGTGGDVQVHGHSLGAHVLRYAARQIGKPYVFGAAGPESYDCSGLTLAAYADAGVSIGIHSATAQYRLARDKGDLVSVAQAVPGDLLFYTDGGGDMYHVTIYAGDDLMIEAPYPGATVREAPVRSGDLLPLAAHFG